jgi:hypothetical protein
MQKPNIKWILFIVVWTLEKHVFLTLTKEKHEQQYTIDMFQKI